MGPQKAPSKVCFAFAPTVLLNYIDSGDSRQGRTLPLRKVNPLVAGGSSLSETSTDDEEAMTTMRPRSLHIVDSGNEFLLTYCKLHARLPEDRR